MNFRRILLAAICTLVVGSTSRADLVTFTVDVTQGTVIAGGTVDWQLFVTVSDADPVDNFGIDAVTANLMDSFGETLSTGTVGASGDPFSVGYPFKFGGDFDSDSKVLVEISATNLRFISSQGPATEANVNALGNPVGSLLFASGSYTAFTVGEHTLSAAAGSTNTYFTAMGQEGGTGISFENIAFVADTFEVTSIPEPSTVGILAAVFSGIVVRRKRRRAAIRA